MCACLSIDVLDSVTYYMKLHGTLDSQNTDGASFGHHDARLSTCPSSVTLVDRTVAPSIKGRKILALPPEEGAGARLEGSVMEGGKARKLPSLGGIWIWNNAAPLTSLLYQESWKCYQHFKW